MFGVDLVVVGLVATFLGLAGFGVGRVCLCSPALGLAVLLTAALLTGSCSVAWTDDLVLAAYFAVSLAGGAALAIWWDELRDEVFAQ